MGPPESDEPVEYSFRVRPAVDVIAEEDQLVLRRRRHEAEERVERGQAAVDVPDGEGASHTQQVNHKVTEITEKINLLSLDFSVLSVTLWFSIRFTASARRSRRPASPAAARA